MKFVSCNVSRVPFTYRLSLMFTVGLDSFHNFFEREEICFEFRIFSYQ